MTTAVVDRTDELKQLRAILRDKRRYMESFLKIRTKDSRLIPFQLNTPQEMIHGAMERQAAAGKPIRVIILKARQLGSSTYVQGRGFAMSATSKYTHGLVIAHEVDGSDNLFGMSKRFYDHLPAEVELSDGTLVQIKPTTKYSNRKELHFEDLDSRITIDTAGNRSAGRSATIQWFHGSEVAFWPDAKTVLTSVRQAVPNEPGTMIVLESTANGVGDEFHSEWLRAVRGESGYVPVFIAWWQMPEYRAAVTETMEYDRDELDLIARYGLTDEQLQWRRNTIRDECGGDVDIFRQEYPSNATEAFLTSGRPYFDRQVVLTMDEQAREPARRGNLVEKDGAIVLEDDEHGFVSVWKEPIPGRVYAIGADVAEGLAHGDYSAAQVIDRETFEQVAEWHGHIDSDLFGDECWKLARWYNNAVLGIEVNNHGLVTNKRVEKLKYRRLYYRRILDITSERQTQHVGWQTSTKTRPLMLDALKEAVRDMYLLVNSGRFTSELLTFIVSPSGKPEAEAGCHDDLVMAMAIALQMHVLMPMPSRYEDRQPRRRRPLSRAAGY